MPLVIPRSDGGLRQGDILRGVPLFVTNVDGAPRTAPSDKDYCVVLSRDCKAFRAATVLVAAVDSFSNESFETLLKDERATLDSARRALSAIRDGYPTPDTVYIGSMPDGGERLLVNLGLIHSVDVPAQTSGRQVWIDTHRVATLHFEAVRHLQSRLFTAVARQGFDDFRWWPDADLDALVAIGEVQLAKEQAALAEKKKERLGLTNAVDAPHPNHLGNVDKSVKNAETAVQALEQELASYRAERERRAAATTDDE